MDQQFKLDRALSIFKLIREGVVRSGIAGPDWSNKPGLYYVLDHEDGFFAYLRRTEKGELKLWSNKQ